MTETADVSTKSRRGTLESSPGPEHQLSRDKASEHWSCGEFALDVATDVVTHRFLDSASPLPCWPFSQLWVSAGRIGDVRG